MVLLAFVLVSGSLLYTKSRGYCLDSKVTRSVQITSEGTQLRVFACGRGPRVQVPYQDMEFLNEIAGLLRKFDDFTLWVFPDKLERNLQLKILDSSEAHIQIRPRELLISKHSLSFTHKALVAMGVAALKQSVLPDGVAAGLSLNQIQLAKELVVAVAYKAFSGHSPIYPSDIKKPVSPWVLVPPIKEYCHSQVQSAVTESLCNQVESVEPAHQIDAKQAALQSLVLQKWVSKVTHLSPYFRYRLLQSFRGNLDKGDTVSKDVSTGFKIDLDQSEKQWIAELDKIFSSVFDLALWEALRIASEKVKLESPPNLVLWIKGFAEESWRALPITDSSWIFQMGKSQGAMYRHQNGPVRPQVFSQAKQLVIFQCYPPLLKELTHLPLNIEKVYVVKVCQESIAENVHLLQHIGIEKYLESSPELGFYQIHMPSLRWLTEKQVVNPFVLVEAGRFDHPIFSQMGWQAPVLDQATKSYSVVASIEAIQKFRVPLGKQLPVVD